MMALLVVRGATQVPTLWFTAVGPFLASIVLACAYWSVRDKPSNRFLLTQIGMWCALGVGACQLGPRLVQLASGPAWLSAVPDKPLARQNAVR